MKTKKIYSLSEGLKMLKKISQDLSQDQMPIMFKSENLTSEIRDKYDCDLNARLKIEIDLTKDEDKRRNSQVVNGGKNKKFIDFKGHMILNLTSIHLINYLAVADYVVVDNPGIQRKNIKFSFSDRSDLLLLLILTLKSSSVMVNVERVNEPSIEQYHIKNIVGAEGDLFEEELCESCRSILANIV